MAFSDEDDGKGFGSLGRGVLRDDSYDGVSGRYLKLNSSD